MGISTKFLSHLCCDQAMHFTRLIQKHRKRHDDGKDDTESDATSSNSNQIINQSIDADIEHCRVKTAICERKHQKAIMGINPSSSESNLKF